MTTTIATIAISSHVQQNPYGVVYLSKRTGELTIERYPNDRERDTAYAILVKTHESVSKIEPGEVWVSEQREGRDGLDGGSVGPFPVEPAFDSLKAVETAARALRVHSSGGITGVHDWEMSDGSIRALTTDEAAETIRAYKPTYPTPPKVCNCGSGAGWDKDQRCLRCGLPLDDPEVMSMKKQRDELADALESILPRLSWADWPEDVLNKAHTALRNAGRLLP